MFQELVYKLEPGEALPEEVLVNVVLEKHKLDQAQKAAKKAKAEADRKDRDDRIARAVINAQVARSNRIETKVDGAAAKALTIGVAAAFLAAGAVALLVFRKETAMPEPDEPEDEPELVEE
jgi:hypothetical protein